jgi:hypothetical protein
MNPFSAISRPRRLVLFNLASVIVLLLALPANAQSTNERIPFGPLDEVDMDQFIKFARPRGFDLQTELERIYNKDEAALARLFNLSLKLKKFNRNARAYGQVVYTCYLRVGELYGVDVYLKVLDRQTPDVQQRIRDFLYYPLLRVPKEKRKENQEEIYKMYPRLFPSDFKFGRNDPIF